MSFVAVVGAGPIGAAVAHRLACRAQVGAVRLIDASASLAAGKALDIRQAGPVEDFDTPLTGSGDLLDATGASVIVLADDSRDGEWTSERGLTVVAELLKAGTSAALVFAGPHQTSLLESCCRELGVPAHRLVGSAPAGVVGAARALAAIEVGLSGVELEVVGRAPDFVLGWTAATVAGNLLIDRIPPHRLLAVARSVRQCWPPGPYAIASATARVVEGLVNGCRKPVHGVTIVDGEFGARRVGVLLPLRLGSHRVIEYLMPSLSSQERTGLVNSLGST